MSARCPYPGVRVVYVREVKGLDSPVLLWHVCLAKDKFLSENLPKQLSSAASFLCVENSPPPCSCFLWPSKWSSLEKEEVFEQEVEMWKLLGGSLYLIPVWGAVLSIVK